MKSLVETEDQKADADKPPSVAKARANVPMTSTTASKRCFIAPPEPHL